MDDINQTHFLKRNIVMGLKYMYFLQLDDKMIMDH